jgi:hypothetical protein
MLPILADFVCTPRATSYKEKQNDRFIQPTSRMQIFEMPLLVQHIASPSISLDCFGQLGEGSGVCLTSQRTENFQNKGKKKEKRNLV